MGSTDWSELADMRRRRYFMDTGWRSPFIQMAFRSTAMILHCRFTPSGVWYQRLARALFLAYVNLHHRYAERHAPSFYVQLDRLEAR